MKASVIVLAAACLVLPPTLVKAQRLSGVELLARCASGDQIDSAVCDGYMMAVADILKQRERYPAQYQGGQKICVPDEMTLTTIREQMIRFSKQRRSGTPSSGIQVVADALRAHSRCPAAADKP